MPTLNIFFQEKKHQQNLQQMQKKLKSLIAERLSCGDIQLTANEISIRLIRVGRSNMIGNVEIEITAHAFSERVEKEDEICNDIRKYLEANYPELGKVRVWLILSELGHSW